MTASAKAASSGPHFRVLDAGDPAPWFKQRTHANPTYTFDTAGGRFLVLGLFLSAASLPGQAALAWIAARRRLFDDERLAFFGVTLDPRDEPGLEEQLPGIRYFLDHDAKVSRLYGAAPEGEGAVLGPLRPRWIVLDPTLRVIANIPFQADGSDRAEMDALLGGLPTPDLWAGVSLQAPILYLPNVFEPGLCEALIAAYDAHGGEPSGFMREIDGRTVEVRSEQFKRRRDHHLVDEGLKAAARARIVRRIAPEVLKVHQFQATRMERYLVACYNEQDRGHFRPHRDNTTKGTAHRRFAVSINLTEDFEGGEIGFPEYGPRTFKPPPGAAVVFSCGLLHTVTPVTRGRRLAFLPFLYDEAAARIRAENLKHLGSSPAPEADSADPVESA